MSLDGRFEVRVPRELLMRFDSFVAIRGTNRSDFVRAVIEGALGEGEAVAVPERVITEPVEAQAPPAAKQTAPAQKVQKPPAERRSAANQQHHDWNMARQARLNAAKGM